MRSTNLTLMQRVKSPISKFFKKVRTIGITITAIGAAIVASPVLLPAAIVTIGGYFVVAGSVMAAVAQTTTEND